MLLVEMLSEAGCPPGVVNVIHGSVDTVNFICDASDIKAISFVGANTAVIKYSFKLYLQHYSHTTVYILCVGRTHIRPWF